MPNEHKPGLIFNSLKNQPTLCKSVLLTIFKEKEPALKLTLCLLLKAHTPLTAFFHNIKTFLGLGVFLKPQLLKLLRGFKNAKEVFCCATMPLRF